MLLSLEMSLLWEHAQWSGDVRGETSACTEAVALVSGTQPLQCMQQDAPKETRLARGERLERHQEGEDTGARRRDHDQEYEQSQGSKDHGDLGGWRQLLECLKHLFHVHGFPFLDLFGYTEADLLVPSAHPEEPRDHLALQCLSKG